MTNTSLRDQLKRLGVGRSARNLKAEAPRRGQTIEELLPGEVVNTEQGDFFLYREVHHIDHRHGAHTLHELLNHDLKTSALLARDERLAGVDLERVAFVDTETTGLAGGAGTYAFLVGVGVFEDERFIIHQYFMRDYDEEPAQLYALGKLLDGLEAVVSFNGKGFDLPLLETRFIMARQPPRLVDAPHLDLLPVARRFWKYRLASCALSSLEAEVLGVQRTREDAPGWLIPTLYSEYARSGDAREMPRIFYHNAQDILSLVTLTARLCSLLTISPSAGTEIPGEDLYGLGRVLQDLDEAQRAESAFACAAQVCETPPVREMVMRDLAYLLKRQGRRAEALPWWQRLVEELGSVSACEELAKHYEWQAEDLAQAITWTKRGLALAESQPPGPKRSDTLSEFEHRLQRLARKLEQSERTANEPPAA